MPRVLMTAAVCLVSACVGGGGNGVGLPVDLTVPPVAPKQESSEPESPPYTVDRYGVAYASNEPVWDIVVNEDDDGNPVWDIVVKTDGDGILIGTREAVDIIRNKDVELGAGLSAEEMVEYFRYEDSVSARVSVTRWGEEPPVARMGAKATDEDRRDIMLAVRMINSALPPNWQIAVESTGADVPDGWEPTPYTGKKYIGEQDGIVVTPMDVTATEEGYIDILYENGENWVYASSHPTIVGLATSSFSPRFLNRQIHSTRIYVDSYRLSGSHPDPKWADIIPDGDEYRISVLLEEILHALGRPDHGRLSDYDHDSILKNGLNGGFLRPIDEAALLAVYGTPLPIGTYVGRPIEQLGLENLLDSEHFTPWHTVPYFASDEMTYAGEDRLHFGSIWRYRQPRPYVMGMDATGAIADTSGSASWSGKLVGLTSAAETVRGDMSMKVDFGATVTGDLEFSNLVKGVEKEGLDANDEGTSWMGGDGTVTDSRLEYGIAVDTANGMFFQSGNEANDGGLITGAFFGPSHEGIGGTLRRSDLAAGFGGRKQEP